MPVIDLKTTGQAATELGVPSWKLLYLIRTGQVPDVQRVGIHRCWTTEAIEAARRLLAGPRDTQRGNGQGVA